jgi:trehalose 2-sulfotransferase
MPVRRLTMKGEMQMKGYVICSEPRSGTNYFCELLAMTGLLGKPSEYFNGPGLRERLDPDYPDNIEAQFDEILPRSRTPNGIYAMKMFSAEFDRVAATKWACRLPELRFVHFERLDYLGQAISEARAIQTGGYRSTHPSRPGAKAIYDSGLIQRQLEAAARGHARWRLFFARNAIAPLYLTYEGLMADPQGAVQSVADFMGLDQRVKVEPSATQVAIQRDAISDSWRAQFLVEEAGLDRFDRFERDTSIAWLRRKLRSIRGR